MALIILEENGRYDDDDDDRFENKLLQQLWLL